MEKLPLRPRTVRFWWQAEPGKVWTQRTTCHPQPAAPWVPEGRDGTVQGSSAGGSPSDGDVLPGAP